MADSRASEFASGAEALRADRLQISIGTEVNLENFGNALKRTSAFLLSHGAGVSDTTMKRGLTIVNCSHKAAPENLRQGVYVLRQNACRAPLPVG